MTNLRSLPERGFTLLEVLVALTILAGALAVMFQVFSRSLETTADAQARTNAASLAQSLLARIGTEIPLKEGETTGVSDDGLQWRVRMSLYDPDRYREMPLVQPYEVAVDVFWQARARQQTLHLSTLRLATIGGGR